MIISSWLRSFRGSFHRSVIQRYRNGKQIRRRRSRIYPQFEALEDRTLLSAAFHEFLDPNPNDGNQFGSQVVPLSTGNVVITSPYDDAGGTERFLGSESV